MHHLEEFIKQGVLRAEAANTKKLTGWRKVHKISLGPIKPSYCLDCGKPRCI
jgi:hypothetical protein